MRTCIQCGKEKSLDEFYYDDSRVWKGWAPGHSKRCKECDKANMASRTYNISPEEYLQRRSQSCGICGVYKPPSGRGGGMHLDHNHQTGELRGTLCDRCNRGIGMFDDDPVRLLAAIKYILEYRKASLILEHQRAGMWPDGLPKPELEH